MKKLDWPQNRGEAGDRGGYVKMKLERILSKNDSKNNIYNQKMFFL